MSTFEDRLWSALVHEHGERMRIHPTETNPRAHRPAILTGTALAGAGLTAAVVLAFTATTSTPPAFAVTDNADGTVTVTLNEVSAITSLNAELAREGIDAKAVPLTDDCPTRGFPHDMPAGTSPSAYTITIVPRDIPAHFTAIVAASENAEGQVSLVQGAWPSPGPACINSTPLLSPGAIAHAKKR
jgi:hypothetical protein